MEEGEIQEGTSELTSISPKKKKKHKDSSPEKATKVDVEEGEIIDGKDIKTKKKKKKHKIDKLHKKKKHKKIKEEKMKAGKKKKAKKKDKLSIHIQMGDVNINNLNVSLDQKQKLKKVKKAKKHKNKQSKKTVMIPVASGSDTIKLDEPKETKCDPRKALDAGLESISSEDDLKEDVKKPLLKTSFHIPEDKIVKCKSPVKKLVPYPVPTHPVPTCTNPVPTYPTDQSQKRRGPSPEQVSPKRRRYDKDKHRDKDKDDKYRVYKHNDDKHKEDKHKEDKHKEDKHKYKHRSPSKTSDKSSHAADTVTTSHTHGDSHGHGGKSRHKKSKRKKHKKHSKKSTKDEFETIVKNVKASKEEEDLSVFINMVQKYKSMSSPEKSPQKDNIFPQNLPEKPRNPPMKISPPWNMKHIPKIPLSSIPLPFDEGETIEISSDETDDSVQSVHSSSESSCPFSSSSSYSSDTDVDTYLDEKLNADIDGTPLEEPQSEHSEVSEEEVQDSTARVHHVSRGDMLSRFPGLPSSVRTWLSSISSEESDDVASSGCEEESWEGFMDDTSKKKRKMFKYMRRQFTRDKIPDEFLSVWLRGLRTWNSTAAGDNLQAQGAVGCQLFKVMSYNLLAQEYVYEHSYLYRDIDPRYLEFTYRFPLFIEEVQLYDPEVLCLQEVQADQFNDFYIPHLGSLGYEGVYKRRTAGKIDGCAIFYKSSEFSLQYSTGVEYHQAGCGVLDRDNVGLIVNLKPRKCTTDKVITIANTHLLFNPRRHDVKLAQVMLLLSEIDRCAFKRFTKRNRPTYNPVIVCGDFNLEPYCSIYNLLTKGKLTYQGLSNKYLTRVYDGYELGPSLLPERLGVTDECQHEAVTRRRLVDRLRSNQSGVVQYHAQPRDLESLLYISNSERGEVGGEESASLAAGIGGLLANMRNSDRPSQEERVSVVDEDPCILTAAESEQLRQLNETECHCELSNFNKTNKLKCRVCHPQTPPPVDPTAGEEIPYIYGSGGVKHRLKLSSVYTHRLDRLCGEPEVTTKQDDWCTVDYILYSVPWNWSRKVSEERDLVLLSTLGLLSADECSAMGTLPNAASPSDHMPLIAQFLLKPRGN